jgi:uncharacterized protein YbjT (DUF2867 family)
MKITISGSLGHIGKVLTKKLVAAGHQVTVISHSKERKSDIEKLGAKAAIGSVLDAAFLAKAFDGAEAAFAMTPPALEGSNVVQNTINAGKAYAKAIAQSGVPRVVMLSSIGADQPGGSGPIVSMYNIEKIYSGIEGTHFIFLRPGYYYTNFNENIPMVKGANIIGANFPPSMKLPLVHQTDIADMVAGLLPTSFTGKQVRFLVSDIRTPQEIAKVLGTAIGNPVLPWVEFTDEQSVQGMVQGGLPEEMAKLYTEMGAGFRSGKLFSEYENSGSPVEGKIKLEDFAKEFAGAFEAEAVH